MIANIPEHIWSVLSDLMAASPWMPERTPDSRLEALIDYCNWHFDRYGPPEPEPDRPGVFSFEGD